MTSKTLTISRLTSGGLITNYYCTSSCRHCLYRCSPKWKKDFISQATARESFKTMRRLGCNSIHIGGGEPLLKPEKICKILETAKEMGINVEYVETNSSWYSSHGSACDLLKRLKDRGMGALLVSISPFHNEYIPFSKVKGVLNACLATGIQIIPWIADFIADISTFDEQKPHSLDEYSQVFGDSYVARLPTRYWISPGGRALETFREVSEQHTLSELVSRNSAGCLELTGTNHFHFDLYGNYIPGLCAGLAIRKNDVGKPLDPEHYPFITTLYSEGIGGFLAKAEELFAFMPKNNSYSSKCELCFAIRKYLVLEKNIQSRELQPAGHYENL